LAQLMEKKKVMNYLNSVALDRVGRSTEKKKIGEGELDHM